MADPASANSGGEILAAAKYPRIGMKEFIQTFSQMAPSGVMFIR